MKVSGCGYPAEQHGEISRKLRHLPIVSSPYAWRRSVLTEAIVNAGFRIAFGRVEGIDSIFLNIWL